MHIKITTKTRWKIEFVETIRRTFRKYLCRLSSDNQFNGKEREEICQLCRVGDKSRPARRGDCVSCAPSRINIPNRRRRGDAWVSFYFSLSEIQFTVRFFRGRTSLAARRGAAPSLDAASVDPLIHGRDLQARAMLLHAMHRHNPRPHSYPLSLLRRIIGRTFNDTRETSLG